MEVEASGAKNIAAIVAASFSRQFWMSEKGHPRPGVAQPQAAHLADVRKAIRLRTPASASPPARPAWSRSPPRFCACATRGM